MGHIHDFRKKMSNQFETIQVCVHEAGHTVCALLMFMKVLDVFVVKNRRIEGETNFEQIADDQFDDYQFKNYQIKSDILLHYAGLMAEKIFYQDITGSKVFPKVLKEGIEEDIRTIAKIIKTNNLAAAGRKRYLYKSKMMNETRRLLEKHWDVVKIVSHALFEKKKLTYEDLKKIICRKTINKKFWKNQFAYINAFYAENKILDNKDLKVILSAVP